MRAEIITDRDSFFALESSWRSLFDLNRSNISLFLSWEWITSCLEIDNDIQLFVVCVYDKDKRLLGVAPFCIVPMRLFGCVRYKVLRHIADRVNCAEYAGFLIQAGVETEILDCILAKLYENRSEWSLIWLTKQNSWIESQKKIQQYLMTQPLLWCRTRPRDFSVILLPDTNQGYLDCLSTKVRYQIRKEHRHFFAERNFQIERCTSQSQVDRFLDTLFELHLKRWKSKGEQGAFVRRPEEKDFYKKFVPKALKNGWLRLYLLSNHGRAFAAKINFVLDSVCYSLQSGFDPEGDKGSGNALLAKIIEQCINEHVLEYDFLGGFSKHKARWGAEKRTGVDILCGQQTLRNLPLMYYTCWPESRYLH